MPRTLLFALLTGCSTLSTGAVQALPDTHPIDRGVAATPELGDEVEALVLRFVQDNRLPGLAVTLVDDGAVVYAGGFGWADVEAGRPLTAETPVLLSSVSKTFVGVLAAQAMDEGFDLNTPAGDLLGYPVTADDGSVVTLNHLLTHHSGLEDSGEYDAHYAPGDPTVDLADFCAGYLVRDGAFARSGNWSKRAAGEAFSYSNVGMACAAIALAARHDTTPKDLVRDAIFTPLSMNDTAYFLADLAMEPAVPYRAARNGVRAYPQYGYPTYPDGMVRAPANDLGRYLAALAGKGALDGTRVISESSWSHMVTVDPTLGTDEDGQALAWAMRRLDDVPLIGHNGGDYGSVAELWFDPTTGDGFVLAANGFPDSFAAAIQLERDLMALVE